ncbi:putative inner membrane protein [Bergeriella denitrificans]|uniref:Putative inner membrane protein n=1 Tax=Bergeriella denitrificans TaxID=494 RepID=A0A378UIP8_BERDE|nr:putative inner membrane protein [Bergeriella denitrificans]
MTVNTSLHRRFAPFLYVLIFFAGFLTACLWLNPQAYLADLPAVVAAIAASALVFLAYALVAANLRAKNTRLAQETRLKQEAVQPIVRATLQPVAEQPEMLALAVCNHGKGPAHNLRFQIALEAGHPASEAVAQALTLLPLFQNGMDALAAGETTAGLVADSRTLRARIPDQRFSGTLKLVAEYEDTLGESGRTESILDLQPLNAAAPAEARPRKKLLY